MPYRCLSRRRAAFFFSTTYQELQETPSPDLVVALFSQRTGERLALFTQAPDDESLDVGHVDTDGYWLVQQRLGGGSEERKV